MIALMSTSALAQQPGSSSPAASAGTENRTANPVGLEDIVVTAQKRSENLQDVPIAVSAVTEQALTNANIRSTTGLQVAVPGLVAYQTVTSFQPFIRGVGSNISSVAYESPVAVYLDGVYLSSKSSAIFDLGTIERIEVIKGPQGTLFGRNATGGAVNVVTRRPGEQLEYGGEVGLGRFDEWAAKGHLSVPVSDTLKLAVSGSFRNDDGYIKDILSGRTVGNVNNYAVMAKLLWSPSDRLDVEATYLRYKTDNNAGVLTHNKRGMHVAFPAGTINATGDYQSSFDFIPVIGARSQIGIGKIRYGLTDKIDLVSTTAYQDAKANITVDADRTSAARQFAIQGESSKSISEELQLTSSGNDRLSWILGLFYYKNVARIDPSGFSVGVSNGFDPATLSGLPFVAPYVSFTHARMPTEAKAVYAQATYGVTDRDRVTVGLRFSEDRKGLRNYNTYINRTGAEVIVPGRSADTHKTFRKLTWRLAFDHKFNDDILGFISYNRGFKSGGYVPTAIATASGQPAALEPEVLDAYEIGLKSELFDRRVRLNLSGFFYKYNDITVQFVDPVTVQSQLRNAAKSEIYGIDSDLTVVVNDALNLRASATYLHAEYKKFPNAAVFVPAPSGAAVAISTNASGSDLTFAPKWTVSLGFDYKTILPGGSSILLSSSYYYNDGFDTQPLRGPLSIPSWSNVTASVTWRTANDKYFVRVWGDNLTNEKRPMYTFGNNFGFSEVFAKPITYGASIGFNF
ncbi:TonB-dependent receptor [Sphingobium sp. AN558]|uniref:TonB-dependent receptor n=1 Tax=Sphingobium sp. AN558 TaxID=3133442 RepID=UPI0030BAFF57